MFPVIFLNFLLYLLHLLIIRRKDGNTMYSLLWAYYTFFAFMSVIIVATGLYDRRFTDLQHSSTLSIEPYFYYYICVCLLTLPFVFLKKESIKSILYDRPSKYDNIINITICILVVFCIFRCYDLVKVQSYSILERREMSVTGESLLSREKQPVIWIIEYILGLIHKAVTPFLLIHFFKLCIAYNRMSSKCIAILIVCFLPQVLYFLANSNRSGFFFMITDALFFLFIFHGYLQKKIKKQIIKYASFIAITTLIILWIISLARYEDRDLNAQDGIMSYLGESFPNLGSMIYGKVKNFTYGARVFSDYFQLLTGISYKMDAGLQSYQQFWTYYTNVPTHIFKTYFGTIYIEFGTLGALLFTAFISCPFYFYAKTCKNNYLYYSVLFLYYGVVINSVFDFPEYAGRFYFIRILITMWLYNLLFTKLSHKNA